MIGCNFLASKIHNPKFIITFPALYERNPSKTNLPVAPTSPEGMQSARGRNPLETNFINPKFNRPFQALKGRNSLEQFTNHLSPEGAQFVRRRNTLCGTIRYVAQFIRTFNLLNYGWRVSSQKNGGIILFPNQLETIFT